MTAMGIVDLAAYAPSGIETAEEIAAHTGIPAEVIRERFGLESKRIAGPGEHVSDLAATAAREILDRHPSKIDALLYMGSPYRDFPVWSAAPKVQQLLSPAADGALAFDVQGVSAGTPIALQVAKGLMLANPRIEHVLLAGGSREHDLIDYENERSRFMFSFGAGGAAVLLRRDHSANHVLETVGCTDGSFADDVMVPAGGSREPTSEHTLRERRHALDVRDPAEMKRRLDPVSVDRFVEVTTEAVTRSGYRVRDIALICPLHTKRSIFTQVMARLGLREQQGIYLSDRGHMSAIDPLVGLHRAREQGRLRDGDLVVLLAAGTGYSWVATAIRWGHA